MTPTDKIKQFRSSYSRCTLDPDFITTFHKIFMNTSIEAREHMAHIHEDRQRKMLEYALYLQMLAIDDNPDAKKCLADLGDTHGKLAIGPNLYDHWLNSLITAVDNYDGGLYPGIAGIWREVLSPGIELMKRKHTQEVKLKAIS